MKIQYTKINNFYDEEIVVEEFEQLIYDGMGRIGIEKELELVSEICQFLLLQLGESKPELVPEILGVIGHYARDTKVVKDKNE